MSFFFVVFFSARLALAHTGGQYKTGDTDADKQEPDDMPAERVRGRSVCR
jgi:hypothetical protein